VDPSAKSVVWSDNYIGKPSNTTIKITVNKLFSSGSKFEFQFPIDKFDVTDANTTLASSVPAGTIGTIVTVQTLGVDSHKKVTLTTSAEITNNVEIQVVLAMRNPKVTTVSGSDITTQLKTPSDIVQSSADL
jgi:hypothetical protein